MGEEQKGSILKKVFLEKKGWIWLSTLVVGMIALRYAIKVDLHPGRVKGFIGWEWWPEIRCKLWQASGMVCDVVIAYSTMLAAVVIFYYSVTENKRLGVPYRKLIAYTVGSLTIPVLFVVTLLLTVFVVVSHHIPWKHTMYVCVVYILLLQTCMIVEILRSTSYDYGKQVICRVERKKYGKKIKPEENRSMSRVYFTGHLEQAIHSEETIEDKKEFLQEFLRIPFQKKAGKLSPKNFRKEMFVGENELEKIYQFYFFNISSAFQNLNGGGKQIERNELYLCIGGFLKELYNYLTAVDNLLNRKEVKVVYHMVLSGIINGMVYSDVEDSVVFCDYILSGCILDHELSIRQLHLYVLFQEIMHMFEMKPEQRTLRIRKMAEWEPIKTDEDIGFWANFWDIWVRMFHIPQVRKMKHFEMAMQTMTGHSNQSQAVLEMLLQVDEEK